MNGDSATERSRLLPKTTPTAHGLSRARGIFLVASVGLLVFLQAINISMLTTVQSAIAADLDAYDQASWFTSAYLVAMSSIAPLMGRFSQLFQARRCITISAIFIFIGTVITAASNTFPVFILGRVVTGSGAAGVLVTASILAIQFTPIEKRGLMLGCVNAGMTTGVSLGAVYAGGLEPKIGWKWLFGIQAPLSFLAGIAVFFAIPATFSADAKNDEEEDAEEGLTWSQRFSRIDHFGAITLTGTIVLFLVGLSGREVLPIPIILSAGVLVVFLLIEVYRAKEPIIPVAVLKSRGTLLTCLATVGFMVSRWSVLFYAPVYAIAVRAWHPAVAGSILIPANAGFGLGGLLAGWLHIRRAGSFYVPSLVTMSTFPVSAILLAFTANESSPAWLFIIILFCNGLATGAGLNYTLVHVLHLTFPSVHPIVLSLIGTFRGFGGSFGSAIGGGLFARLLGGALERGFKDHGMGDRGGLVRKLIGSPATVATLKGTERYIAVQSYSAALKGLWLAATGLSVIVVFVQAGTGWKEPKSVSSPPSEVEAGREEEEGIEGEEALLGGS